MQDTTEWAGAQPEVHRAPVGYFGASTGSAAALIAAARLGDRIAAVVSRGGGPIWRALRHWPRSRRPRC